MLQIMNRRMYTSNFMSWYYSLVVRLKDCSYEDAGQDRLCHWLAEQHDEEVADWFSA